MITLIFSVFGFSVEKSGLPRVVLISFEQNDQNILKGFDDKVAKLKACGVPVTELRGATGLKEVEAGTSGLKNENVFFWIDSHGGLFHPSGFLNLDNLDPRKLPESELVIVRKEPDGKDSSVVAADQLTNYFSGTFTQPSVFMDTCHSGHCKPCSNMALMTSCGTDERSFPGHDLESTLVDLLCSAANDCELWWSVDRDKNGVIDAEKLTNFWITKKNSAKKVDTGVFLETDPMGPQDFRLSCYKKKKGIIESKPYILWKTVRRSTRQSGVVNSKEESYIDFALEQTKRLLDYMEFLETTPEKLDAVFPNAVESKKKLKAIEKQLLKWQYGDEPETISEIEKTIREISKFYNTIAGIDWNPPTTTRKIRIDCTYQTPSAVAPNGGKSKPEFRNFKLKAPRCQRIKSPSNQAPGLFHRYDDSNGLIHTP